MSYARNLARLSRSGIPSVDTIQDLRDITVYDGLYPEAVYVKGHTTKGDGGGGIFDLRIGTLGEFVDDNGIIVVLTSGDGSIAYIQRHPANEVDLAAYGIPVDGTVGPDLGAVINYWNTQFTALGGGDIWCPRGGDIRTSETIVLGAGVNLACKGGQIVVSDRDARQQALCQISPVGALAGDLIQFDKEHKGCRMEGICVDCTGQTSGNGIHMLQPDGTISYKFFFASLNNVLVRYAAENGVNVEPWISAQRFRECLIHSNGAAGVNFQGDNSDVLVYTAKSTFNAGNGWTMTDFGGGRLYDVECYDNDLNGVLFQGSGGNTSFIAPMIQNNMQHGYKHTSDGANVTFLGGTVSASGKSQTGSETPDYSDVHLGADARHIKFIGGFYGAFKAGSVRYIFESLANEARGIALRDCMLRGNWVKGRINGRTAKFCDVLVTDSNRDAVSKMEFRDESKQTVSNPDLLANAVDWDMTLITGSSAAENDARLGWGRRLNASADDTTQSARYTVTDDVTKYFGRVLYVQGCYSSPASVMVDKQLQIVIGGLVSITVVMDQNDDLDNIFQAYIPIASDMTGNVKISVQVKTAGQGAHTESLFINNVTAYFA